MDDRFNTPHTDKIELDFLGYRLQLAQDPNSKHLGTTVWDSSMVFVKFLEQNCRKGELSHPRLAGKRVIELGAGCGLAGLGMALLGCHVIATDQIEVLPLLMRNLDRNMARAKHSPSESPYVGSLGLVEVVELDWGEKEQIRALKPPFDYIIGTDIVYKEQLLQPLLSTLLGLAGPKTTILLANEYRSSVVHERMLQLWKENFNMKIIPRSKMDTTYQHECIQLFSLKPKVLPFLLSKETSAETSRGSSLDAGDGSSKDHMASLGANFIHNKIAQDLSKCDTDEALQSLCMDVEELDSHSANVCLLEDQINVDANDCKEEKNSCSELSDWEIRRRGSMAARLLQNVL